MSGPTPSQPKPPNPENRLGQETSPYLLQHKNNPVAWRPWGPEALAEAKSANKPILLSVGYAACHWCHVMAHESFEDEATAAVMNKLFVNIKVDREERPDIDQIYMSALHALGEQGGWPLTMFLTPDGAKIGDSILPKTGNMGYPAEPAEVAGFKVLLKKSAPRMRALDLARIEGFLATKKKPSDAEIKSALEGVKCRCGTHVSIMKAVKRAAAMMG